MNGQAVAPNAVAAPARPAMVTLLIIAMAVLGLASGLQQIYDNTLLVHMATGLRILDTHRVPHADPYSFTAHGHAWIVQSWLVDVLYALAFKLAGGHLIAIIHGLLLGAVATGMALLVRTRTLVSNILGMSAVTLLSLSGWSGRPSAFGLAFFLAVVIAVERRLSPITFAVLGALWINCHGSWPIGIVWMVVRALGDILDNASVKAQRLFRSFIAFVGGILAGGILSPAGWRVLLFPLTPLTSGRGTIFGSIIEWKSLDFHAIATKDTGSVFLGLLIVIVVLTRRRVPSAHLLPAIVFLALGLYSQRNLPMFAIAMCPVLASALGQADGISGRDNNGGDRKIAGLQGWRPIEVACGAVLVIVAVAQMAMLIAGPSFSFKGYPVAAIKWVQNNGYDLTTTRVAAPDYVGCYRIWQNRRNANVFIDDRYDMYPVSVSKDAKTLGSLVGNPAGVLDKYKFDVVIWQKDKPLTNYLAINANWREAFADDQWKVFVRTASTS